MSVRAIAVRGIPTARLRVVSRDLAPRHLPARPGILTRLADDQDLIGLKVILLGILLLVGMILEVPL